MDPKFVELEEAVWGLMVHGQNKDPSSTEVEKIASHEDLGLELFNP
jgi:hypothetical protein